MLKIYGRKNSSNVQKVLWCCGEMGLTYDRIDMGREFGGNHPHRDACVAVETRRAIGNGLAAAEPDAAQRVVQRVRMRTLEFREHLAFAAARKIRARRGARHEEPGKSNRSRHGRLSSSLGSSLSLLIQICMREPADESVLTRNLHLAPSRGEKITHIAASRPAMGRREGKCLAARHDLCTTPRSS